MSDRMTNISQELFMEERALFHRSSLKIRDCVFDKGESPLKECADLDINMTLFRWKYPLWYCSNVRLKDCTLFEMARAGIWYTDNLVIEDTVVEAPKNIRRANHVKLSSVTFPNAAETLWFCDDIRMDNVTAKGDYFALGTNNIRADHFTLIGNYSFDGTKNMEIRNSRLISKDAFWNTENVTVRDSFLTGEYLGWNAKNLTLINCTIESLQGLCYVDNLVMKNCHLINTTLAFEYSSVDAQIDGKVDSVLNPRDGVIRADRIDTLIIQKDFQKPGNARIICGDIGKTTDVIDWRL